MRHSALAALMLAASLVAQTVSLQSVVVSGGQLTVTYSKDFATCAHLKILSGQLVHAANFFCASGTNVVITESLSSFNSNLALGVEVILCHGNNGGICSAPVTVTVVPSLIATPPTLSLAAGGVQQLAFDASPLAAGSLYVIAGSISGTTPGFSVGPFFVPLNPDVWFTFTLENPETFPLSGFQGVLGGAGTATATITLPPGISSAFAGITLNHAVGLITSSGVIVGVSGAVSLTLVP